MPLPPPTAPRPVGAQRPPAQQVAEGVNAAAICVHAPNRHLVLSNQPRTWHSPQAAQSHALPAHGRVLLRQRTQRRTHRDAVARVAPRVVLIVGLRCIPLAIAVPAPLACNEVRVGLAVRRARRTCSTETPVSTEQGASTSRALFTNTSRQSDIHVPVRHGKQ